MPQHITVAALATELGMDRSALRKAILRLEIEPLRVRSAATRGQATLAVSLANANIIRKHYAWRL